MSTAQEKRRKTKCERCFFGENSRDKNGERAIWYNAWGCTFSMDEADDPCEEYTK